MTLFSKVYFKMYFKNKGKLILYHPLVSPLPWLVGLAQVFWRHRTAPEQVQEYVGMLFIIALKVLLNEKTLLYLS